MGHIARALLYRGSIGDLRRGPIEFWADCLWGPAQAQCPIEYWAACLRFWRPGGLPESPYRVLGILPGACGPGGLPERSYRVLGVLPGTCGPGGLPERSYRVLGVLPGTCGPGGLVRTL